MTYLKAVTLQGVHDNGDLSNIPIDGNNHLEVSVHGPRMPFGSLHTENLRVEFQSDGVYGLNTTLHNYGSTLSGVVTTSNSAFTVSSGTTIYALSYLQSRKRIRYRPGQGVVGRFAALYTTPVADSYQVAGFGHDEDGVYFGYKGTDFGILYNKRGQREIQTLTVTTGATSNGNVTITLNSVAFTVAVTNASNIQRTVWEISQGTYAGWKAEPRGATVIFIADSAGNKTGTFSFSAGATGSAATIAETVTGAAATESFIKQSDWNGDKLNGLGKSGFNATWTNGNVFEIGIQYLGFGAITFKIEIAPTNSNNPEWVTVHTMKLPNTLTDTSFGTPSFPFTMAVYSAGSTTNLTVKVGSYAGGIEGLKLLHGPRMSYVNVSTSVGAANIQALFSILNTRYYSGKSNQAVINIRTVSGALKHTSPCIFYIIKNGALAGNPNFGSYSTSSCSYYDTAATTVTYSDNSQLIWTGHLGDTGEIDHHFANGVSEDLTLQPGEWITLGAKAVTGTPSYVTGSINTREDL